MRSRPVLRAYTTTGNTVIRLRGNGSFTAVSTALCPDHLTLAEIGEADNLRGRVVRAFFRLMRLWPI